MVAASGRSQISCHWVIASPQYAIAHVGSAAMTSLNCCSALSYQKLCSNATPRSNAFCCAAAHEVGKLTVPSFSVGTDCVWCS